MQMRRILPAFLMILASRAQGQDPLTFTRTDASIVITEHTTSAENVEITMLAPDYPKELLETQCQAIGKNVGVVPRGLAVFVRELNPNDPKMRFVKATFAINGLIDREQGILNIEPIVRAMAGASAPYTIKTMSIVFAGEKPTEKTIRKFAIPNALYSEAKASVDPAGIEYTIVLLSQDPEKLSFPTDVRTAKVPEPEKVAKPANLIMVWPLLALAAIAGGVLVYLALLRGGRRAS